MSRFHDWKIFQIIPAQGYMAVIKNEPDEFVREEVICWALIENVHKEQRIVGMCLADNSDGLEFCNDGFGLKTELRFFQHYEKVK